MGETAARSPAQIDRFSVQRKSGSICHCLLTEMPPAAMALPRVSLLTCALRGIFSPRVHILPSHEKTSQWWTLVPASDGHVTCFGVSLRSQCRSRGALHPIHFWPPPDLSSWSLQQGGYTVSTSQLKHSIIAFIVVERICKVNFFWNEKLEIVGDAVQRRK